MKKNVKGPDHNFKLDEQPTVESTINRTRLRPTHWQIWILSSMGIMMEGFALFVIGIALPLIHHQYNPSPVLEGLIASSVILGTIAGSASLGRIGDLIGRKRVLFFNSLLVLIFSILAGFSWNLYVLIIFMFFLGVGAGADYPICASYVAELMPSRIRGKMLIGAFSFQAVGMLLAAVVGVIVLKIYPSHYAWHYILAFGAIPALFIFLFRLFVPESPRWSIEHGRTRDAVRTISLLSFKSQEKIVKAVERDRKRVQEIKEKTLPYSSLFKKKYLKRTVLTSVPWFLMDISTYGVGIFTPTIIAAIIAPDSSVTSFIARDIISTEGAAVVDIFLVAGFITNILLVDKLGRIKLQLLGFAGMTAGLVVLSVAQILPKEGSVYILFLFGGFIIYNYLMNAGPNATTFILPAELFSTKLRSTAHGFSASFAKSGAVVGIFLIPILRSNIGLFYTLLTIASATLLGLIITWIFKIETMGKSLEELSHVESGTALERRRR